MGATISKKHAIFILSAGLVSISFSSIFIKLCDAPSLAIAVYRLAIPSLLYSGYTCTRKAKFGAGVNKLQLKLAGFSGVFLAIHFAAWISSLKFTSVSSSVVLVQSSPIFVSVASAIFLHEKPSLRTIIGILITLIGVIIIGIHDFGLDSRSILGNFLAIVGAIGAAGYFVVGRKLRVNMDTITYVTLVYSTAALILFIIVIFVKTPLAGFGLNTFILLFAIALVPQMIGHTSLNWALKYFSATSVSILTLSEPIGASLLALLILGEPLGALKIVSGLIILFGVAIVFLGETKEYSAGQNV